MTIFLADIDTCLEHQSREGDPADPGKKREYEERGEDDEHYSSRPVSLDQVVYCGSESPGEVDDACDPNKLFWKEARQPDIDVREDEGNNETEGEEYNGITVE